MSNRPVLISDIRCTHTIVAVLQQATNKQLEEMFKTFGVPPLKGHRTKIERIRHLMKHRPIHLGMSIAVRPHPHARTETHEVMISFPVSPPKGTHYWTLY